MTAYRKTPKRRLAILVPDEVAIAIRDLSARTCKSYSELGTAALVHALGMDGSPWGLDPSVLPGIPPQSPSAQ